MRKIQEIAVKKRLFTGKQDNILTSTYYPSQKWAVIYWQNATSDKFATYHEATFKTWSAAMEAQQQGEKGILAGCKGSSQICYKTDVEAQKMFDEQKSI